MKVSGRRVIESWDRPPVVRGDFLWASDWHVPYHDGEFAAELVDLCAKWRVPSVVLGGDFLDMAGFSKWFASPDEQPESEFGEAERVLTLISHYFRRIFWIAGNHEKRIHKKVEKKLAYTRLLRMAMPSGFRCIADNGRTALWVGRCGGEIVVSEYAWAYGDPDGSAGDGSDSWQMEHPATTSVSPGKVGRDLATKFQRNIIFGHNHMVDMSRDRSGRFWVIESGMIAHPRKLEYCNQEHSTRPAMCQGAVVVKSNHPYLLTPESDWDALKTMRWSISWKARRKA